MGRITEFPKVKLFCGVIFNDTGDYREARDGLKKYFGSVDLESPAIEFDCTDYYFAEMGEPLWRGFIAFEKLIDPQQLAGIKILTNEMEDRYAQQGCRRVNLDPGYISTANVIIATTKNHYHRVPLNRGIFAHIEYVIKGKKIHFLEWTYRDFQKKEYVDFFEKLRLRYREQLRETGAGKRGIV